MLEARVALLTVPFTLAVGQAALASSVSLMPLMPRTNLHEASAHEVSS